MRPVRPEDFKTINQWRFERKAAVLGADFYPHVGLIVDNIAAGFLLLTDAKIGLLEHFVANPKANPKSKKRAIVAIGLGLERAAKSFGMKFLMAYTKHRGIEHSCLENGYKKLGNAVLLGKEL